MKRNAVLVAIVIMAYASIGRPEAIPSVVGVWRLVSFVAHDANGAVRYPMGKGVVGQLIYYANGSMCATVMKEDRAKFASGDRLKGTDLEVRTAFEGYIAYFGTFTIDAATNTLTHHVKGSLYPNLVGTDLVRRYELEGTRLTLTPIRDGVQLQYVLVWELAGPSPNNALEQTRDE